jgi:enoyl-CoA hydratase
VNLAFATDLRVVARDARIVSGFLQIGLHPGGGHGVLLGRTGSREGAAGMAMFGQEIDGARAAELGMAWTAVEDSEVESTAMALAERPAADPALARRVAKSLRAELGPPGLPWDVALDMERASQMWSMRRKNLDASD